jgi:hypothetical protein
MTDCFGLLAAPFDGKKGNIINPNQHLPKEGAAQERECIPGLEFVTVAASVEIGTVQRDEEGRDMGPMTEEQFIGAVSAFCHCTSHTILLQVAPGRLAHPVEHRVSQDHEHLTRAAGDR